MARDKIHDAVKQSLINDGWTILEDPFRIKFEGKIVAADIRAERLLHLTRDNERIVVEIKSFIGRSFIKDLQAALGQYQMYAFFLEATEQTDEIYLAVSAKIYEKEFKGRAVQKLLNHFQVHLLVVDISKKEITEWITQ